MHSLSSLLYSRCIAAAIVVACLSAYGADRQEHSSLRVATYNTENFFDRYDDPYINDFNQENGTKPKKWLAMAALARVIKGVNADVIALQEVENRGALEEFNRAYLRDMGYRHVILVEANNSHASEYSRGIDVAVLSRIPVAAVTSHQNREFRVQDRMRRFSRDFLQVRLKPHGFPDTHLFVLHAPSKRGERRAYYRRLAEARESAVILTEQFAGKTDAFVIVTGDFNDEPDSKSLGVYTSIPAVPLCLIPPRDTKGRSYTWYGGEHSSYPPNTFDHILVSAPAKKLIVGGRATIWNDADAALASDHRPVYITLRSKTRKKTKSTQKQALPLLDKTAAP